MFGEDNLGYADDDRYVSKGPGPIYTPFITTIDEVLGLFSRFQVDFMDLQITSIFETDEAINLLVSSKGEGGLKIRLRTKP